MDQEIQRLDINSFEVKKTKSINPTSTGSKKFQWPCEMRIRMGTITWGKDNKNPYSIFLKMMGCKDRNSTYKSCNSWRQRRRRFEKSIVKKKWLLMFKKECKFSFYISSSCYIQNLSSWIYFFMSYLCSSMSLIKISKLIKKRGCIIK